MHNFGPFMIRYGNFRLFRWTNDLIWEGILVIYRIQGIYVGLATRSLRNKILIDLKSQSIYGRERRRGMRLRIIWSVWGIFNMHRRGRYVWAMFTLSAILVSKFDRQPNPELRERQTDADPRRNYIADVILTLGAAQESAQLADCVFPKKYL